MESKQLEAKPEKETGSAATEQKQKSRRQRANKNAQQKKSAPVPEALDVEQQVEGEQVVSPRKKGQGRRGAGEAREGGQQRKPTREFKNFFSEAIIMPEQIRDTCLELAQSNYLDQKTLYSKITSKQGFAKNLRVHERVCETNDRYKVCDFSLKTKSRRCKDIDLAYFQARNDLTVWSNVRDGNTLLIEQAEDEDGQPGSVEILRTGLPRLYNLAAEAVKASSYQTLSRDEEQAFHHCETLAQVKKALMNGKVVEVRQSMKTNGDGASVTWSDTLDAWVISSQNVSIVARSNEDIQEHYPEESRYYCARKIAQCWFSIVKRVQKMGQKRLAALKADLSDNVFLGDFVGNDDLVNLIKYSRENIRFHSVVPKDPSAFGQFKSYCEADSHAILSRHPIDVLPVLSRGTFSTYEDLCQELSQIHTEVSNSSLSAAEEGAVLIFVQKSSDGSKDIDLVISMCKIKSVQYSALRLIVDMLQAAVQSDSVERSQDQLMSQYVKEMRVFSRSITEGLHPETFYIDLFSSAFTLVAKKSLKDKEMYQEMLFSNTNKFLELVLKANEEKNQGKRYVGQIELESQQAAGFTSSQRESAAKRSNMELPRESANQEPEKVADKAVRKQPQKEESKRKSAKAQTDAKKPQESARERKAEPAARSKPRSPQSITALVLPPYSLTKDLMDRVRETYNVVEQNQLDVGEIESHLASDSSKRSRMLVVLSSLDSITEQSRLCNLKLYAYKCKDEFKGEPASNFYLDKSKFYAHSSFKNALSAASVRKEVEKMVKVANSPQLIKLINPARMHLSSEEELMVVLQLQEPPSVDVSVDFGEESKQEVPEPAQKPVVLEQAESKPKKQASKKQKKGRGQEEPPQAQAQQQVPVHQPASQQAKVLVFFPIGIPGMGKTYFAGKSLRQALSEFKNVSNDVSVISSDDIRQRCCDQWLAKNPRKTLHDSLKASVQQANQMFNDSIAQKLQQISKKKSDEVQVIYIDKNFPPKSIKSFLETFNEMTDGLNVDITRVALVPQIQARSQCKDYPFSTTMLVQCLTRCIEREGHLTLSNDDPERLAKIILIFAQQFKGIKFDQYFAEDFGFDKLSKALFTVEHEDLELPPKLQQALLQAINSKDLNEDEGPVKNFYRLYDLNRCLFSVSFGEGIRQLDNTPLKESIQQILEDLRRADQQRSEQAAQEQALVKSQSSSFKFDGAIEERDQEESDEASLMKQELQRVKKELQNNKQRAVKQSQKNAQAILAQEEFEVVEKRQREAPVAKSQKNIVISKAKAPEPKKKVPASKANQPRVEEEFEVVTGKKNKFQDSDIDSDEFRIPNSLYVKLDSDRRALSTLILQSFKLIPEGAFTATIEDTINSVSSVLTSKNFDSFSGWDFLESLQVTCKHVGRDEDVWDDSPLAQDFERGKTVIATCSAILLVPGKAVIGIVGLDDQETDDAVPFATFLHSDFRNKAQITNFVKQACTTRGPFASIIQKIQTGGKIQDNKIFVTGNVGMGRDRTPITAYLITLQEPFQLQGVTAIQY